MDNNTDETQHFSENPEEVKIQELETKIKNLQDEYNGQRAQMKELYLQKEEKLKKCEEENVRLANEVTELGTKVDEAKSQLLVVGLKTEEDLLMEKRKAQEEIASLQHMLDEALKENKCCRIELENETRKLQEVIAKLQEENTTLRIQMPRETVSESPQISLSTVTKSLRKVVSQLGADSLSLGPADNLEENMRKAQEDADELRSLVEPLEEEIKALKEKLRSTDQELQKYKEEVIVPKRRDTTTDANCEMCDNYEAQLVKGQNRAKELEKKLLDAQQALYTQQNELTKEVEFRKEMEEKWNEKKEQYKMKLAELKSTSLKSHQTLIDLKQTYSQTEETIRTQLHRLVEERESVCKHLQKVQKTNDFLMGKYNKTSHKIQNEHIDMPNTVEELHLSLLKLREELIIATIAHEVAQGNVDKLQCKVNRLSEQISDLTTDTVQLRSQLDIYDKDHRQYLEQEDQLQRLQLQFEELMEDKKKKDANIAELRQRLATLQKDLDISEHVQKDFVRLSQTLQIELEKIREADSEVRWQYEEDVDECQHCHAPFIAAKKNSKKHCRHCGRIFCQSCLSNIVKSGPKQRPSSVCDVCHTLLVRDTAPYFSQDPPHTPD